MEWIASVVYSNTKSVPRCLPSSRSDFCTSQTPSLDPSAPLPVPKTLYTLPLHTGPISSIRSHALPLRPTATPSPHLITAGWDGLVGIWDLTNGVNEGEPGLEDGERKRKRRKPGVVITKVGSSAPLLVNRLLTHCAVTGVGASRSYGKGLEGDFRPDRFCHCVFRRMGSHCPFMGSHHRFRVSDEGASCYSAPRSKLTKIKPTDEQRQSDSRPRANGLAKSAHNRLDRSTNLLLGSSRKLRQYFPHPHRSSFPSLLPRSAPYFASATRFGILRFDRSDLGCAKYEIGTVCY